MAPCREGGWCKMFDGAFDVGLIAVCATGIAYLALAAIGGRIEPKPGESLAFKLNRDRTVAVATDYEWNEDMSQCPKGVRVQLLGHGGVAAYGTWNGREDFWVAWAPLPKRRKR